MRKNFLFLILLFVTELFANGQMQIIKVTGSYGIINKGINQGVKEDQVLYVKRETGAGLLDICQVKVLRATANRAAVEQITGGESVKLLTGDKLFIHNETPAEVIKTPPKENERQAAALNNRNFAESKMEPIDEPPHTPEKIERKEQRYKDPKYDTGPADFGQPWVSFNVGAMFPNGELAVSYSPSLQFGASYMVETGRDFNLGVEINNTYFNGGPSGENITGLSRASASLLEAYVVFQKFFGDVFFIESGGGIYRPKIRTVSIDGFESSYIATKFGLFGGSGVFVRTSPYAGIALKGRVHNYFDQTSKHYFGLSGGFRFKIH